MPRLIRKLVPVKFLRNPDYRLPDGSWVRFPDQIWIENDKRVQTPEQTLLLQQQKRIADLEKVCSSTLQSLIVFQSEVVRHDGIVPAWTCDCIDQLQRSLEKFKSEEES